MNRVSEPVKNLKLCQAFWGHNPMITDCTEEITDTEFYIEDSQEIGYTIKVQQPTQDKTCKVINPSQDTAVLLPIDNRFIKNNTNGIADAQYSIPRTFISSSSRQMPKEIQIML